jgi:hypothetical protein
LTDLENIKQTEDVQDSKFTLKITNFQTVHLPANSNGFILSLNVISNKIGNIKLIGYIINSFNGYSKILFSDLVKEVENKNYVNNSLSNMYNIEVMPKLPIVNYLALRKLNNFECFELTGCENLSICYFTGEK